MKFKFHQNKPFITSGGTLFVPGEIYDEKEIPKPYLYKFKPITTESVTEMVADENIAAAQTEAPDPDEKSPFRFL